MITIIIGIILVLFTAFSCLPKDLFGFGLEWGDYIIQFLKGSVPVFSAVIGVIAITVGFSDLRDKKEAKREEEEARQLNEAAENAAKAKNNSSES